MTIDVTKYAGYAALTNPREGVSKETVYVVLKSVSEAVSKEVIYVHVEALKSLRVSKETVYSIMRPRVEEQVSKYAPYAVLRLPDFRTSKYAAYAVLEFPSGTVDDSKFVTYAHLLAKPEQVSKFASYAVLRHEERVSKFTAYCVVQPNQWVSKFAPYAVMTAVNQSRVTKFTPYAVLFRDPSVLLSLIVADTLTAGDGGVRESLLTTEALTDGPDSAVKLPLIASDVITGGNSEVRLSLICLEILYAVPVEGVLTDPVIPIADMRGLSWSVHKKPMFRTKIASHVSGHEVRAAFMQYPIYEFNLTFEWLPNRPGGNTDLETMMGFFMQRQGSYDAFCFTDPTDYHAVGQTIAVADGGTLEFPLMRTLGGFTEPVGQYDLTAQFGFIPGDVDVTNNAIQVPAHSYETGYGPIELTSPTGTLPAGLLETKNYWVIRYNANYIQLALTLADAMSGNEVDITTQGSMGGVFAANNSVAVYVNGTLQDLDDYDRSAPNKILFPIAPAADAIISADFRFYFVCRFVEDMQDYENFMYRLWTLQECAFQSIIQDN